MDRRVVMKKKPYCMQQRFDTPLTTLESRTGLYINIYLSIRIIPYPD